MRVLIPRLLLSVVLAGAAWAEDTGMVSLETADDARGWDAVGKLVLGDHGFCTGALISPQLVLTAAHCLYDKTTGVQIHPEDIEFQAGFRNGRALAYRRVARAVAHPDYRYTAADDLDRVIADLALLELDQPIRLPSLQPFETGAAPVEGDPVAVVSYAQYREEAPSIQESCDVLARSKRRADPVVQRRLRVLGGAGLYGAGRGRAGCFGDFRQGRD
jgi:protease YdgD